jgi:hypothetical protein
MAFVREAPRDLTDAGIPEADQLVENEQTGPRSTLNRWLHEKSPRRPTRIGGKLDLFDRCHLRPTTRSR